MNAEEIELLKKLAVWLGSGGVIGAGLVAWKIWKAVKDAVVATVQKAMDAHTDRCTADCRETESTLREELRSVRSVAEEAKRKQEALFDRVDENRDAIAEHQVYAARTYITQDYLGRVIQDVAAIREQVGRMAERHL